MCIHTHTHTHIYIYIHYSLHFPNTNSYLLLYALFHYPVLPKVQPYEVCQKWLEAPSSSFFHENFQSFPAVTTLKSLTLLMQKQERELPGGSQSRKTQGCSPPRECHLKQVSETQQSNSDRKKDSGMKYKA